MREGLFLSGPGERGAALVLVLVGVLAALALTASLEAPAPGAPEVPARMVSPLRLEGSAFSRAPPFDPARAPLDGVGRLASETPPIAAAPVEPPLRLVGILADSAVRRVLFAGVDTWLEEGGTAWGWTIDLIEPRRVTVHRGSERRVIDASEALSP
ncbi:hypothetical protein [Aureimonas ureilytica]|uniref:hypothetical protein n=1 Tax=Aureimonas ureilytica TaxID=401562 RepID=UPI0003820BD8|nr:hypothetical protein [Aureimonas ureilytica]